MTIDWKEKMLGRKEDQISKVMKECKEGQTRSSKRNECLVYWKNMGIKEAIQISEEEFQPLTE